MTNAKIINIQTNVRGKVNNFTKKECSETTNAKQYAKRTAIRKTKKEILVVL